ncbi:ATP synthase F0 subunit C, partial [Microbacterium esteraromaticum]
MLQGGGAAFVLNTDKALKGIGAGIAILAGLGAALAQGYIGGKAVES